jgi:hypothetical protein
MLATGGQGDFGGGGMPQRIIAISRPASLLRMTVPDNQETRPASATGCNRSRLTTRNSAMIAA